MTAAPIDIKARTQAQALEITWEPGHVGRYPFVELRAECGCAGCVDEMTGQRLLDPTTIPDDITVKELSLAGNYALKIVWSDGHDTGLYTWTRLRKLCPCPKCRR